MNLFASSLLLSQISLESLLEMAPDDRLHEYGHLVGVERIVSKHACCHAPLRFHEY